MGSAIHKYIVTDTCRITARFPGGREVLFEDFDTPISSAPGEYVAYHLSQAITEVGWLAEDFAKAGIPVEFELVCHGKYGSTRWTATLAQLLDDGHAPLDKVGQKRLAGGFRLAQEPNP